MKSLTERFLEGLAEAIDSLTVGTSPTSFNSSIGVLSSLIFTGSTAFSHGYTVPLLMLLMSFMLILLTHSPFHMWVKIPLLILMWASMASAPLPFMMPGEPVAVLSLGLIELRATREGVDTMLMFVLRVVAAAAIFTSFTFVMGWRRIVRGLQGLRVPRELGVLLNLSIIHIPLFLREAIKMLSAREARIMRKIRSRDLWRLLSTVVGDLLLRSYERASILEKAIKARSFATIELSPKNLPEALRIKDLCLLAFSLGVLALTVWSGV